MKFYKIHYYFNLNIQKCLLLTNLKLLNLMNASMKFHSKVKITFQCNFLYLDFIHFILYNFLNLFHHIQELTQIHSYC